MSKVLISNLIDEINALLSRPVGSVSRKASPDIIHQREQLKQLRSHLENLTDDAHLGNLDKQYQALVSRLQKNQYKDVDHLIASPTAARTDKLETLPTPLVSNSFGTETDLIKETSTMTNSMPEPNSTFVNDRMIAALQQAIQQTLQQVVKESVQLSVQQVVSQTLAVERALMVGEISASINKIVESQQRSQISQELVTLNQQKQKLNAEISQLESDRADWMQHFQEFQSSQQDSLDRSLRSVNSYLQDQIRDQITDTVQQTVTGTVNQTVAQTIQETLQENLINLPAIALNPDLELQREQEFANKVQEQTDRFLSHLDEMFSSTFRSLEQDIQEYQTSIEAKLGHIETLEQKGEALINALVDRISQQHESTDEESPSVLVNILPELPDDIPPQYLETVAEPADENLINALLAGNEFGEPIVESVDQIIEVSSLDSPDSLDIDMATAEDLLQEDLLQEDIDAEFLDVQSNLEVALETSQDWFDNNEDDDSDTEISEITEIESILGASSDTLFEVPVETDQSTEVFSDLFTGVDLDADSIEDREIAIDSDSLYLSSDFDLEAETQVFENPNTRIDELDLQALNLSSESTSHSDQSVDDPELMQWLEESSDRPSPVSNIAEISPDQELLSWLGNDALDMAKLPPQPSEKASLKTSLAKDLAILDDNISPSSAPSVKSINGGTNSKIGDSEINNQVDQLFNNSLSDQASDSEESLILLVNKKNDNPESIEWEDSLVDELNSDLDQLEFGMSNNTTIATNLDRFIRNTPYALNDWDTNESQTYPTIIDVTARSSNVPSIVENPDDLFADQSTKPLEDKLRNPQIKQSNERTEVVIDIGDLQLSPFNAASDEIPEIFDNPESLFDEKTSSQESKSDDMDAIFADVIAKNAAKYSPSTPFETSDEIDQLFSGSDKVAEEPDESTLDTLLYGFDPSVEIEPDFEYHNPDVKTTIDLGLNALTDDSNSRRFNEIDTFMQDLQPDDYQSLDTGANTMKEGSAFAEPIEIIQELDTILQGFADVEVSSLRDIDSSADATKFVATDELLTVIENSSVSLTQEDEWSFALEKLEAELTQPKLVMESKNKSEVGELSADEFFASLEYNKLNNFADAIEKTPTLESTKPIANLVDLEYEFDPDEDSLLNDFADSQSDSLDGDWNNLLDDLSAFNFNEPLLDDRREQLGLSSVAPITDSSDNVLDIDSLVMESRSISLVPPPPEQEVYSLDHNWILGIDIGSTAIRTSLFNSNTGKVYSLFLGEADEMPCKLAWTEDHSLDDPITKDIRVLVKKSQKDELETGEVAISHFKQFLKLGLPYRGVSAWQPIIQCSDGHQASLRWLIAALKNLLEQIQTRANHPKLPDLGLILLKLSGVVFGYPANWSDTYILNVREAIVKSGLINQAEQVMAVEQAIAPVLALIHAHKISQKITLLIDAGAVTTSLCLIKGIVDIKAIDRAKLHIRNLDYAGISISQDIIVHLFYPHWRLITNSHRHLCKFDHLSLPEVGADAPQQRILLQQYLLSSSIGQQMMELADRVKVTFGRDSDVDSWNEELMGQPIVVLRRELENLILQPFIQRINRELNAVISNAGILGEDVHQVLLLGNTMHIPLLSRWLTQKLPNAEIESLSTSNLANGLAVSPLYPHMHDVARQQYSDYFLLQEICRLNLTQSVNPNQLLKQLQMRGVNIKACRDRILSVLQGDLPEGLFPWQEPDHVMVLEDPTLSSDLFAGKLFELETDGTYQPNVTKFQQLRVYLQAIISNMSQNLNEPLVFPEVKV